jgi:hypothetical protein
LNVRIMGAWATAGVALWTSMGALDVAGTPEGTVRIAMLPPVAALVAAVVLALLAGWGLGLRRATQIRSDSALPFYALSVLVLPYLPWLPDLMPGLRVLAGPVRYFVWLLVVSQVVWAALGAGRGRRVTVRMRAWSAPRLFFAIAAINVLLFGIAALTMARSGLYPGGDEPHYLVMMQSLLHDHDLAIENNHQQQDYRQYYDGVLPPHALARGVNGQLYSVHPIGLPILLAPFFALAGYPAVVMAMLLLAAAAAACTWLWVRRLTGSVSAATFAWAATSLSVTYLFSAGTVYPEIVASLAVMLAFLAGLTGDGGSAPVPSRVRCLVMALAAAMLPWLSSKYALMSAAIVAVGAWRIVRDTAPSGARIRGLLVLTTPYVVSLMAWFWYFYRTWGSPWPSAAYGGASETQMALANLQRGLPGLLFDQEYGLLSYAPVLVIAVPGFWHRWRAGGVGRQVAVEVMVVFGALFATVAGHTMWWGGTSVPARFLVSGLLLLALPVAWEYQRAADLTGRRAVYRLLLAVGLVTAVAVLCSPGMSALANRRDGMSRLLLWWSPDWHLWAFLPDFIMVPIRWGVAQVLIWIGAFVGSAYLFTVIVRHRRPVSAASRMARGSAFLRADAAATVAVVAVVLITPLVRSQPLPLDVRPESRARVMMLDTYDPQARPVALRYDPLSRVAPEAAIALFELRATPGSRRAALPVPLLLNARFALPAGQYRVTLDPQPVSDAAPLAGELVLQGGRHGGSLARWQVASPRTRPWQATFEIPADISYVGFRASGELAAAIGGLHLIPVHVVPTLARTAMPEVLGSLLLGDEFVVLLHDGASFPEAEGFWVRGEVTASITVVSRSGRLTAPVPLRVRNGPFLNVVRITTSQESMEVVLQPGEQRDVRLAPTPLDGTLRMRIHPERGFVPAKTDPGSTDVRVLGCWVEAVR